ncbi:FAD-binding oxidoreductase [Caproiciproducens sp. NJN-50]|uniref:FAD-binding oxidoreductase n=1 Tax=Acutalibacteraceae TaxID=3082771 RepID=UPI000FFE19CE|nr:MULTISPECIES: FAD-binding oxidoreductase [Acutalibacteraceae]QAT49327.1 FAD-binding oxidoreductase [Caproiciproducens sp. NJN-50]
MANYNPVTPEIIAELEKAAPGHVVTGADVNPDYSRDEMPIYGTHMPDVSIDVQSTEEVAAIMKICYEHNIPVTTRGAGTGLVGGCTPVCGGVVICTMRMNKILSYDLENFAVTVQPGVLLQQLAEDALTHGCLYPPDPGEKMATLGGNVSTNAGGMRAVKYGCTRDYVRAMTVVLPSGEIVRFGATVSKTSSGYSLKDLMIGSEGTLGIITELTLKLVPAPQATVSLMAPFEDLNSCISTVPKFFMQHFRPQALEFFEREILISSEEYLGKQVFPRKIDGTDVGAYLLVTFDGDSMDELNDVVERASEMLVEEGAMDVLVADTAPKLKDIWAARSSFLEGIEEQTKLLDECDVVVPVNKIAPYVEYVNEIKQNYDFEVKYFGHAGDGNLHIYECSVDMEKEEFEKQVEEFLSAIYKKTMEFGGQISGEHGIGFGKVHFLEQALGPVNMELMRGIKKVFDPKLILNPGKVCMNL